MVVVFNIFKVATFKKCVHHRFPFNHFLNPSSMSALHATIHKMYSKHAQPNNSVLVYWQYSIYLIYSQKIP